MRTSVLVYTLYSLNKKIQSDGKEETISIRNGGLHYRKLTQNAPTDVMGFMWLVVSLYSGYFIFSFSRRISFWEWFNFIEDKYCTFCPEKSTDLTVTIGVGTLINDPFCDTHSIIDSPPFQ